MIFNLLIGLLTAVLSGVLGLIPAYNLPASVTQSFGSIGAAAGGINGVFPVTTLGLCIGVVIGLRLLIAVVAFISWLYGKIPLKFT